MKLSSQQLPSGKWGIYSETGLLATVDSQMICETIMANLATGRRDAPFDDVNALYQVPELRQKTDHAAVSHVGSHAVASSTQAALVNASQGKTANNNGADAEALASSQGISPGASQSVPQGASQGAAEGSVTQKSSKTAKKQTPTEPLKGRAKARANGSAKRKRRSTSHTKASLAS